MLRAGFMRSRFFYAAFCFCSYMAEQQPAILPFFPKVIAFAALILKV